MKKFSQISGYELKKEESLADIKSTGYVYHHMKSGARIVAICNEDDNKVFSIGFRTPPADSTGVPHIIEHSVLCGSKEFPAKDPFVELAKGSLNTFLNAMTFSDKTIYPIASCNSKDFQNLMHVYLDAVFYPNIYKKEEIFLQEGWHYELESLDDELTYNGVVYNEMKGVYSSAEQQLERAIQQSLFPDTAYGTESGGDPDDIPTLTYGQFLDFHKRYYHPSNSYIYLYGDLDIEEKLKWIDENYLSKFDYAPVDSEIQIQEPFEKMREMKQEYSITEDEDTENKTYFSYNVVIDTSLNKELYLAFQVIQYVLLSAPGAPLKQALIDANIGDDIMCSFDSSILQPVFEIIAKNAKDEQKEEFLSIIHDQLTAYVKKGLDQKSLQGAINYYEFRYREADYGRYPKGLMYGIQVLDSWLYDDEKPFLHVCANDTFEFLKKMINSNYYEDLIQKYLIDNTHATFVTVYPKVGLTKEKEEELSKELAEYKATLSQVELEGLIEQTKNLRVFQDTPSTKEELEMIPLLSREDIGKSAFKQINEEKRIAGIPVLHHNIFTNKIAYMDLAFDVTELKQFAPYLSLLAVVLGYIDTQHHSFMELANEINIHTGGIHTDVNTFTQKGKTDQFSLKFEIGVKVLYDSFGKSFELIEEILQCTKLEDAKRLKEIIAETKSRLQMKLPASGHSTAVARALSYSSESAFINDSMGGIGFYRFLEHLNANFDKEKDKLIDIFKKLMHCIFRKEKMLVSITADDEGYSLLTKVLEGFGYALSTKHIKVPQAMDEKVAEGQLNEGFKNSGKIQYVARTGNFIQKGYSYSGSLRVLKVILSYDYLWVNIRVKGGAYGAMCGFSVDGSGFFTSYRDPNLAQTIAIYENIPEFLKNFNADERDVTKYIIGTVSDLDSPLSPAVKGRRSFALYLSGVTDEDIQRERDEVLSTDVEKIRSMTGVIQAILDAKDTCVIGNERKIEESKEMFRNIENLN